MVSDRINHRPLYGYIFWSRASIKSPPDFQHNRRMNWRRRRNERIKRKTDLIRKTITLNFLAHFLEILCRHRKTNAVKIDQNCNAIAHLINLYDRRFIKHIATIATISSKIPIKRALNPKNWEKKGNLPWVSFSLRCMVMNFLSAVLIFEINVSNPSKKERKKKNKDIIIVITLTFLSAMNFKK